MAKRKKKEITPQQAVDKVLAAREKQRVIYFPVKHFSPACAFHVARLIKEVQPVGVLVEGPSDANELIPFIVHEDTYPPLTIFSSYVDRKNIFELNGVLSPDEDVPARYRAWWPMTEYCPEYVALKAGAEVGAELMFIDAPLAGTIPYHHVRTHETNQLVDDRHLAQSAYFDALRSRQRRRSFDEFWNANFETGGWGVSTERFIRAVLTFAWCARNLSPEEQEPALEADGTIARELHMKAHIAKCLKAHPEGLVVVVTGAFHSVALNTPRRKLCKSKARKADLETMLTGHSHYALASLYGLNRLPNYGQVVWEQLGAGADRPFNAAAMQLLIEVMRKARSTEAPVSTADAVGAYSAALNLAVLRRNHEVTIEDLLDAVQMGYIKGDRRVRGGDVENTARQVLTGHRLGRVTSEAGQAPLIRDYYEACRRFKLDISGVTKTVRCDLHKQRLHRLKSAFLHQCTHLTIPMFGELDNLPWEAEVKHYKGPDLVTGENMHLIGETWSVAWRERVDDRLLELCDRGASVGQAAGALLREQLGQCRGSAADTTRLLLRSAQMMLLDLFDELLLEVEEAIAADSSFDSLVSALSDFVVLHSYRDALATEGHRRLLRTIVTLFNKAAMVLPTIANANEDEATTLTDRLQTLVRVTLTFEAVALDRELLSERIADMVDDPDGTPVLRGAGFGVLFSFGSTREKVVARELSGYLRGSPERVLQAGEFLDGLFGSSKSIFMGSPRLVQAINEVLGELPWDTFKILLPDLRRAFSQFIPNEIDKISVRVSEQIGIDEAPSGDEPIPEGLARVGAGADRRVSRLLQGWL